MLYSIGAAGEVHHQGVDDGLQLCVREGGGVRRLGHRQGQV